MNLPWIVSFAGGRPGFERDVRASIVAALEDTGFTLDRMKFRDEDGWEPFDGSGVLRSIDGPWPGTLALEGPGTRLLISLSHTPFASLTVEAAAVDRVRLFAASEALADVCTPDVGWVFPVYPTSPPFPTRHARLGAWLTAGSGRGYDFDERGPGGLGVRTFFGPRVIARWPVSLDACPPPAVVTKTAWGGWRVDVVPDPAAADEADILDAFETVNTALSLAGGLAAMELTEHGLRFHPAPWWTRDVLSAVPASATRRRSDDPLKRLVAAAAGGAPVADVAATDLAAAGAALAGLRAERVDLSRGDFRAAIFDRAVLVDVDLDEARLVHASFRGAQLDQVGFRGVDASTAVFAEATIVSSFLDEARLVDANFDGARLELPELGRAAAARASFVEARIHQGNLANADLSRVRFVRATIHETDFSGANLSGADFTGADIEACNFSGARLDGARWDDASVRRSTFDRGAGPR